MFWGENASKAFAFVCPRTPVICGCAGYVVRIEAADIFSILFKQPSGKWKVKMG